jgi:hypothetical protein
MPSVTLRNASLHFAKALRYPDSHRSLAQESLQRQPDKHAALHPSHTIAAAASLS